ncbi:MAG: hypothetical protein ACJAZ2_000831 [Glaciecola sp.]|jgi:hypothetical protein
MINFDEDIFKYSSYDVGKLIISSQSLNFNNPRSFNDPFDCDINLLKFDYTDVSEEINAEIQLLKANLKKKREPSFIEGINALTDSKFEEFYKKAQINKVNNSSICCFSKTHNDTTMWSHYAASHTGVCLIFDPYVKDPFISRRMVGNGPANYSNNHDVVNYLQSKIKGIENIFFSKSKEWEYESEYRYISFEEYGLFKFDPNFLKGVIFGQRTNESQIIRMKELCEESGFNNLSFGKMIKKKLELEFERIT